MDGESQAQVSLEEILITNALLERPAHEPDLPAEIEAFHLLGRQMASQPDLLLRTLMQTAVSLCRAGSAGVSLLETNSDGDEIFRWVSLAGTYEPYHGGSTPRDFSPCGTCLDRNSPQLYAYPGRRFTYLNSVEPPAVEVLVIPFGVERPVFGTIWIVSHDQSVKFDSEDIRVMTGLADFTAAALRVCLTAKENIVLCQALKAADRRKDEFMAVLAHELRNPLTPIRNAVELLQLKRAAAPEVEWAGGVIDRQIDQMSRLINDLLDISRISRNQLELRLERVALQVILQGAIETSRPFVEQHGQQLRVQLPTEPIFLQGDLSRLAQAFSNLLNNAAKFTDVGGCITLSVERQGSDAVVVVEDTGMGIAPDMLPRVFELYTQVEGAGQRSEGGLGIGLALVKRLIEMHNGSIEAKSAGLGQGSQFVVRLPIDLIAQQQHGQTIRPEKALPSSHFRVLVVDDNRDAADSLVMMLRATGNEPRAAYDGLSALGMAQEFRPDVALIDIGLPKFNGYKVAQHIREQPWGKQAVLIAVTASGQDEDELSSKDAGFDHYLIKPVAFAGLMKLLTELPASLVEA